MMKRLVAIFTVIAALSAGCSNIAGDHSSSSDSQKEQPSGSPEEISNKWEISSTFKIPYTSKDGTKAEYVLIGKKNRLGFLLGSGKRGKAKPELIVEDQPYKYMWHFWGKSEELNGNLTVVGLNEAGEKHKVLMEGNKKVWQYPGYTLNPNQGADHHVPTTMEFSSAGLWKLKVYFNDELFGDVVVNVQQA
ncbi:DUF4871 domain-containing protein [Halobacillus salinarum]|uniref:DUF4871 domain-containing protein n=1 Tax=Halobacillus salinarum TaxID=2932257 RepID=A0ABY4EM74_9BACI|nr:DUF4871 domain-containing protein [Halobacillus salinarum]UOQ44958.1 DUF4871 domain-containing protein [Halobacillus salinarum]